MNDSIAQKVQQRFDQRVQDLRVDFEIVVFEDVDQCGSLTGLASLIAPVKRKRSSAFKCRH